MLTDEQAKAIEDLSRVHGKVGHVEHDGLLITGQNPASSEATAQALLTALQD
jgi:putative intracellular protease/amidase